MARVIGLRAKATAMPVPSSRRSVAAPPGPGEERVVGRSRPTRRRRSRGSSAAGGLGDAGRPRSGCLRRPSCGALPRRARATGPRPGGSARARRPARRPRAARRRSKALPSAASMLSSSLRTMATCSGLSAMSSSTWRLEPSAAAVQGRGVEHQPGDGGQPVEQGGAGLGEGHGRHVVRAPGPTASPRGSRPRRSPARGPPDAGGHVDLALDEPDLGHQLGGLGRRGGGQLDRAGVGGGGREGAEADHQAHAPGHGQARRRRRRTARQWKSGSGPTRYKTSAPAPSWPPRISVCGPGQLGGHAVDDAGHRPAGPLVDEVVAVEGDHQLGRRVRQRARRPRRRPEPGVHPALEGDHQDRVVEDRLP